MSYSLTKKRRQLFTYDITQNQVTFTGNDSVSNSLEFPTGSSVKVYHNDTYVDPADYTISGNSIVFTTSPNLDGVGTHQLKVIVQSDMTDMNDYAIKIKTSADTYETYLIENDPNYDPNDTNSYYSKIRIEDDYLRHNEWSSQDFAISTAMDAITDSKAYTNAEVLAEISRATGAESDLDTRLAILEAAATTGYTLNTFNVTAATQSTFYLNYDVGQIAVFINGILLDGSDYTATDGTSIVLSEPADQGDIVSIPEYSSSGAVGSGGTMAVSETAPANPDLGDMWFNTADLTGLIYYNDGTSSQWVPINSVGAQGPQGTSTIAVYATLTSFPTAASLGDMAYAADTDLAYVYNGTSWIQVSQSTAASDTMQLNPLSAAPSAPTAGTIAVADYTNWDPLASSIGRPYAVFYDGAVWQPLSPI